MRGTAGTPYLGLRPFEREDAELFFGRTRQINDLERRLRDRRFVAVIGRSGSGKSSLVKAGLLPLLAKSDDGSHGAKWHVEVMRPGGAPIRNLALALGNLSDRASAGDSEKPSALRQQMRTARCEAGLRRSSFGLAEMAAELQIPRGEKLLLVVDQFEEIFRYEGRSVAERQPEKSAPEGETASSEEAVDSGYDDSAAFVKLLLAASRSSDAPVHVLLTMRLDYLGDCSQYRDLPETINDSQFLVPRLTRRQRREAIERPAEVNGWTIEPSLLQRLLNDSGDDPDQLPVLQHALMRTALAAGSRREMGPAHYEKIGRTQQALSDHAEAIYKALGSKRLRTVAERLFKALTELDREGRSRRRPQKLEALIAVIGATRSEIEKVIEAFRVPEASFLMPPAPRELSLEDQIDISHEALIRKWGRLSGENENEGWEHEEVRDGRIYRSLVEAAEAFEEDETNVLSSALVEKRQGWWDEDQRNAAWAERYGGRFDDVKALLLASERQRQTEIGRQQGYEKLRRAAVWLSLGLVGLAGTGGLLWMSLLNAQKAETSALELARYLEEEGEEDRDRREEAEKVARQARGQAAREAELKNEALILQERAVQLASDQSELRQKAEEALLEVAAARRAEEAARLVAEAKGREAEAAQAEAEANLQDFLDQQKLSQEYEAQAKLSEEKAQLSLTEAETSRTAKELARVRLLARRSIEVTNEGDAATGLLLALEALPDPAEKARPYVPEAEQAAYQALQRLHTIRTIASSEEFPYWQADWSPDGSRLVTADSGAETATIWTVGSGREPVVLEGHEDVVRWATFAPDGRRVATASFDETARIWDVSSGEPLVELEHNARVASAEFDEDGGRLVTTADEVAFLWNSTTGKKLRALKGHQADVLFAAFNPDGTLVVTTSADGTSRVWNAATGSQLLNLGGKSVAFCAAFSPDGSLVAVVFLDGSIGLWNVATGRTVGRPMYEGGNLVSVSFAPDGRRLAVAGERGFAIWDVMSGERLQGWGRFGISVVFDSTGASVLTASGASEAGGMGLGAVQLARVEPVLSASVFERVPMAEGLDDRGCTSGECGVASPMGTLHVAAGDGIVAGAITGMPPAAWNPDGKLRATLDSSKAGGVLALSTRPRLMAVVRHDDSKLPRAFLVSPGQKDRPFREEVMAAAFSPSGDTLAALVRHGSDWQFLLLSTAPGEVLSAKNALTAPLVSSLDVYAGAKIEFDASGDTALAAAGGRVFSLSLGGGSELAESDGGRVLDIDAESAHVIYEQQTRSGSRARVWDVARRETIAEVLTFDQEMASADLDIERGLMVTTDRYGGVSLWDLNAGEMIAEFGVDDGYLDARFLPDGSHIVAIAEDGIVRKWKIFQTTQELREFATSVVPRGPLTEEEQYEYGFKTRGVVETPAGTLGVRG